MLLIGLCTVKGTFQPKMKMASFTHSILMFLFFFNIMKVIEDWASTYVN